MNTESRTVVSSDGGAIFAEASGDRARPHAVLLHGLALSGAVLDEFCARPDVLDNFYIVRYDIRGHGRSCMPATPEGHASKLYADDFKAVADAFGLQKPILIGWSMGGIIGADIAAHLPPDTLGGIFYLSSAPSKHTILGPAALGALGAAISGCSDPSTLTAALAAFADACLASPARPSPPYRLRCALAGAMALQPNAQRGMTLMRAQDAAPLETLMREGLPVYCMYGAADPLTDGAVVVQELEKHAGRLKVRRVEGAGHALFWEQPELVARALLEFFASVAQGQR